MAEGGGAVAMGEQQQAAPEQANLTVKSADQFYFTLYTLTSNLILEWLTD